jgi:hypothetical protein
MNKKILLSTLAGGIVSFLLGWLIFGFLLAGYYKSNTIQYAGLMKDPPDIWAYLVGSFLWAWMFSYVFLNWANALTFARGATAAIIISAPVIISYDLFFFASMNLMNSSVLMVDVTANVVMNALVGGVVGIVLGMNKSNSN